MREAQKINKNMKNKLELSFQKLLSLKNFGLNFIHFEKFSADLKLLDTLFSFLDLKKITKFLISHSHF
jgi:hypothetical protein